MGPHESKLLSVSPSALKRPTRATETLGLLIPHPLDVDALELQARQMDTMGTEAFLSPVITGQPNLVHKEGAREEEGGLSLWGKHMEKTLFAQS